eukprot:GHVN01006922.1.p1 GENE.GHVN01006922.1~~GHVN01006922.1.p1  ORF type:complete len:100 (-),score=8.21 GHVN01006922.1:30-329(-)
MKNLFIISSFLFLASCGQISSEEVSQEVIKTDYSVNYNEELNSLKLSGSFVLDHSQLTYVKLEGESNLLIDSEVAIHETNIFHQHSYGVERSGYIDDKN